MEKADFQLFSWQGILAVVLGAIGFVLIGSLRVDAATITVDTAGDAVAVDSVCSLREALENADDNAATHADCVAGEAGPTVDVVNFDIPGAGPHTIAPSSELPTLNDPIYIDGESQSGSSCGTLVPSLPLTSNTPHTIMIEIDLVAAGFASGIILDTGSDGSTVRGLAIFNAAVSGFTGGNGVSVLNSDNTTIECNHLGTMADSSMVAGNASTGLNIGAATGTIVHNNLVAGNTVGGIANASLSPVNGTRITGNLVGVDANGDVSGSHGNGTGVYIGASVSSVVVGGVNAGDGNIVAGNTEAGVVVVSIGASTPVYSAILGNSIFGNEVGSYSSGLGIDLLEDNNADLTPDAEEGVTPNDAGDGDSGPNDYMNFPVISDAEGDGADTEVSFSLDVPAGNYRIEFFSNDTADPSGYGEGQTYVGSTTVAHTGSGSESFTATLAGVDEATILSATTTEDLGGGNYGSTSEFSEAVLSTVDVAAAGSGGGESDELADTGAEMLLVPLYGAVLTGFAVIVYRVSRRPIS